MFHILVTGGPPLPRITLERNSCTTSGDSASFAYCAADTAAALQSAIQVDAEVRDKMLGMVEDFARALQPSQFQAAYESLLVSARVPQEAQGCGSRDSGDPAAQG